MNILSMGVITENNIELILCVAVIYIIGTYTFKLILFIKICNVDLLNGNYIIRKLSPVECERLQTVADNYYTAGVSDTQRYKMLGNGWTVDVIVHIIKFI